MELYFDTLVPNAKGKIYDTIKGAVGTADNKKPPYHFVVPNAKEFMQGSSKSQSITMTMWVQYRTKSADYDWMFWISNSQEILHDGVEGFFY